MSALGELVLLVVQTGKPQAMSKEGYKQYYRDLDPLVLTLERKRALQKRQAEEHLRRHLLIY